MSRSHPFRVALTLALLAAVSSACGSSSGSKSSPAAPAASAPTSGTITVLAAASLTGVFTDLGKQFEAAHPGTTVKFSFGASSALAQQIIAGAPADVFASASPKNMTQVTDAGDATGPKTLATNVAEIAVAPTSASKVTAIGDLAMPGVTVALCQPQVPCGALAQTVLGKSHVTVKPVTQGLDVKSTLAYVTGGQADAAIVYVTDVQAAGSKVKGVEISPADNASTAYPIATVKNSKNTATAMAFEDFVLSPAGQAALKKAGFQTP
jgi:molybdate transport system substrate-binding protein